MHPLTVSTAAAYVRWPGGAQRHAAVDCASVRECPLRATRERDPPLRQVGRVDADDALANELLAREL
jgi:hypothetical protein